VSLLCRRIHRLSVNILLAAHGILDPTLKCDVHLDGNSDPEAEYPDALAVLQFALFIPSMTHLAITFTGTRDAIGMTRDMRRCRRILRKFPSIREVSIELQMIAYDSRFLSSGGMSAPLQSNFQALLDTIVDLPSLDSVRVSTGWDFDRAYMLESFPSVEGLHLSSQPPTSLFKKVHRICKDIFPRSTARVPSTSQHTPIIFLADTPLLVLPAFYPWTMSVLSSRAITALRLEMLIAAVDWAVILREIADTVPRLVELTILGVRMPMADLIHSVFQFRALTTLTTDSMPDFVPDPSVRTIARNPVDIGTDSGSSKSQIQGHGPSALRLWSPCLANLTTLATRPEHLEVILQSHSPLPALVSLCVRLELLDLHSPSTVPLMCRIITRLHRTHKWLPLLWTCARTSYQRYSCAEHWI
jgi:hypothetical protein